MEMEAKGGNARRKEGRMKEGPASSIGSRCSFRNQVADEDPSVTKVHSSFRIEEVSELFSKMTGVKEELLREIGFNGLMHLPRKGIDPSKKGNRKLAFWLLVHMDHQTGTLDLGGRGKLELTPHDVNLVLGLPCEGEELPVASPITLKTIKSKVKKNLFLHETQELDLDSVRTVLDHDISRDSPLPVKLSFITAAVIWAISHFLAPKGRPAKVNTDILQCLANPMDVCKVNWSSYVLKTLKDSSLKVKNDLKAQAKTVCLDGCLLFIEVAYLDNLRFETSTTTHYTSPRVKDFSYELLDRLIKMDKFPKCLRQGSVFGKNELRHPAESFYTRGIKFRDMMASVTKQDDATFTDEDREQLMEYINNKNEENKKRTRQKTLAFLEQLCNDRDRETQDVAKMIDRWITVRMFQNLGKGNSGSTPLSEGEIYTTKNERWKDDTTNTVNKQSATEDALGHNNKRREHFEGEGMRTENKGKEIEKQTGVKRIMLAHGIELTFDNGGMTATSKRGRYKRAAIRKPRAEGYNSDEAEEQWNNYQNMSEGTNCFGKDKDVGGDFAPSQQN